MLHVGLIATGLQANLVRVVDVGCRMVGLTTIALLVQQTKSAMEDIGLSGVLPTVLKVYLTYIGLIQESIAIVVVVSPVVLVVAQYLCIHLAQMDVTVGIGFHLALRVAIEINGGSLFILRFQIIHVDLAGYRLVAIAYGRGAFRHHDTFHPGAWDIAQRIGCCSTTEVGQVLSEHLHISA